MHWIWLKENFLCLDIHESYESWILGIGKFCLIGDKHFWKYLYILHENQKFWHLILVEFFQFFIYLLYRYWNIFPNSKNSKFHLSIRIILRKIYKYNTFPKNNVFKEHYIFFKNKTNILKYVSPIDLFICFM